MVIGGTGTVWGSTGRYLVVLGSMGYYWVIMGRYWSVLGGSGSVKGGTGDTGSVWSDWSGAGRYLVLLGQYWANLAGTWWYWFSITQYCLVLSCIGSVKCLYACIYIGKSGDLAGCYHSGTDKRTNKQTSKER